MTIPSSVRRYDLDWLKVLATLFVFLYHCSMFFNPFDWHVKNNEIDSGFILTFSLLIGTWIMPLFFMISGLSSYQSLQKRSWTIYIRERFVRLGIPLVFGVFILAPPQVYVERVDNNQFSGSFFEFLPHAFNGWYMEIGGTGNFAFVGLHLWYLLALIMFSILSLPFVLKISPLKKASITLLFSIQILLIIITIWMETVALGGWDLVFYFIIFLIGYYVFSSPSLLSLLKKTFLIHLTLGILSTTAFISWFLLGMPIKGSLAFLFFSIVKVMSCWNLILSFYYLANKYLSFTNKTLKYWTEASLPFYVLHQPIIVLVGFSIKDLTWSIPAKLVFIIVVSFFLISMIYHYIIQHLSVLRILFGIKRKGLSAYASKGLKIGG